MPKCINQIEITPRNNTKIKDINDTRANKIKVNCGKCINCQINKRRQDIKRVIDEAKYYKYNLMITLTYESKHIPIIDFKLEPREKKKIIQKIRNWNNETEHTEIEKIEYFNLINEYTTLRKFDTNNYIRRVKKAIKKNKKIKDKDFKYFGCGEYPYIKINRGRPHYHIIFLFNDIDLIKYFIQSWRKGNIAVGRGDNEIDQIALTKSFTNKNFKLTNADKLNCIIKQESKKQDIKRIYKYIKNKNFNVSQEYYSVLYVAGYTNKKKENLIEQAYYKDKNNFEKTMQGIGLGNMNYKQIKKAISLKNKELKERDKAGKTINEKIEPYIFKSQKLGERYALENAERFIKNPTQQIGNKKILLPKYYIQRIKKEYDKTDKKKAREIIINKNKIISELQLKELDTIIKTYKYNLKYDILENADGTIDIIEYDNKKDYNLYNINEKHIKQQEIKNETKKIIFGEKENKSETFIKKINIYKLNKELKEKELKQREQNK